MANRPGGALATRPLQFLWIVDCSGSMQGKKIEALSFAIREAIPAMQEVARALADYVKSSGEFRTEETLLPGASAATEPAADASQRDSRELDPYLAWLSIPADRRPPTHYDLLGLAELESDAERIHQAARDTCDVIHSATKGSLVRLRGMGVAAQLAYELQRGGLDLIVGRGWREVEERTDIAAHHSLNLILCASI